MSRLEKFGHGGDLLTASALFNVEPEQLLDFSANINPLGPPEGVLEAIENAKNNIVHYPDPAHRKFLCALARKYAVPEEMLLVGNGAAECMALVLLALAPTAVGVIYPSFVEYTQLAQQYGAEVIGCVGREETGFLPVEEELGLLLDKVDILFIGHPNNPTGLMYSHETLSRLAVQAQEKDAYLVVDEAFIDFLPEENQPTLLKHLASYPHVILLRSLTKFYAIPGLRLGFAAAHPDVIARMKGKQVPWSVNCFALAAGEACCAAGEYEAATRRLIADERVYLHSRLSKDLRFRVWPGQANFLLIRLPEGQTAEAVQDGLGRRGIMIRNCAMYPGLTARDFRIAVRSREENNRLLRALAEMMGESIEERKKT
ncbi:threonine-phosphate decarboxylase CobD [Aneurinibacillus aneurinilyticus]|uniref:threonine-phosphate decarboxylase n=1 Tax=Aneurinibacillus aneurinilyticus TaxID=1391 RepID=A0A848CVQ1_ANEAE|nr:threonine-phosphate decarboxylase CobD [Aneurinibacillus aneurinilyticus]MED0670913.1 threonine-phosphate decarboxylase CobD [Aneurinibacillus aneurinilyticus]NME98509.1 threonine-phosphate decarboxylase [Aneurinibacillus aneurinilyticus]